ncbi:aldehyde dehydrogenase family protein [Amycolatopsis azurea]|uniref:aldehyde dehydrogenase family protein n=1 Tax=Amycolatopsis azurea TaxID=36819 RepID=UPI0037F1CE5B
MPTPTTVLPALGARGPYFSRTTEVVTAVTGSPLAELSLVPRLYVQRSIAALAAADTVPAKQRAAALADAGVLFTTGTVGEASAEDYHRQVARSSGMPISFVRRSARGLGEYAAEACASARLAKPLGAAENWRDPDTRAGSGVWVRRGDVLAVNAPANTPAVHVAWLDGLALGYRVAVRPSRREPFTPHRLVLALRAAGFGDDQVMLLPTDHVTADAVIADADVAIAFGADDVVRKYGAGPMVLPQGPGRSKILITADTDLSRYLDMIVESVADQAGTGCVNATAVFVEGDPAPVAEAISERLERLPTFAPEDERAVLPVRRLADAMTIDEYLRDRRGAAKALLGGTTVVGDLGDGSAALRPAVFLLDRVDAPQTRIELGFPCVWVAPWSRADGMAPLRDTLVLAVVTDDAALVDQLVGEPSIRNVHVGAYPTTWHRPGVPHDGYLGEFLMRAKTVIREGTEA